MVRQLNYKRLLCGFLSLLLLVVASIAGGCSTSNEKVIENERNEAVSSEEAEESVNSVITNKKSNGVSLVSAVMLREAYAENDISLQADSAYTLSLNVTPEDATCDFVWTVSGNEDDGITLDPHNMSANVTCNGPFGVQKVITATLRYNPEISASCTVDYLKRFQGVTVKSPKILKFIEESTLFRVELEPNFSNGTISDSIGTLSVNGGYVRCNLDIQVSSEYGKADSSRIENFTGNCFYLQMIPVTITAGGPSFFNYEGTQFMGADLGPSYYDSFLDAVTSTPSDNPDCTIFVNWELKRQGIVVDSGTVTSSGKFDVSNLPR